jgi:hypothetical protein
VANLNKHFFLLLLLSRQPQIRPLQREGKEPNLFCSKAFVNFLSKPLAGVRRNKLYIMPEILFHISISIPRSITFNFQISPSFSAKASEFGTCFPLFSLAKKRLEMSVRKEGSGKSKKKKE